MVLFGKDRSRSWGWTGMVPVGLRFLGMLWDFLAFSAILGEAAMCSICCAVSCTCSKGCSRLLHQHLQHPQNTSPGCGCWSSEPSQPCKELQTSSRIKGAAGNSQGPRGDEFLTAGANLCQEVHDYVEQENTICRSPSWSNQQSAALLLIENKINPSPQSAQSRAPDNSIALRVTWGATFDGLGREFPMKWSQISIPSPAFTPWCSWEWSRQLCCSHQHILTHKAHPGVALISWLPYLFTTMLLKLSLPSVWFLLVWMRMRY